MIQEEHVRESLRSVTDPEMGISIVDLGLVYAVEIDQEKKSVVVQMTLTSPMCPEGPEIMAAAEMAARRVHGVEAARVDLVWSPPWDPRVHCSEDAKAHLGIWD